MKRHFISLAVIIAIAVGWYVWRRHALELPAPPSPATATTTTTAATTAATRSGVGASSGSSHRARPVQIRRITPEDRQRLVEQLTAARAVREAHGVTRTDGAPPALPDDDHTHDLDRVSAPVLDALQASIPFLAACYEQHAPDAAKPGKTAVAQITLTNDPDIGAVIDADQILDDQQAPLDPQLDACLRSTIQTLQLRRSTPVTR